MIPSERKNLVRRLPPPVSKDRGFPALLLISLFVLLMSRSGLAQSAFTIEHKEWEVTVFGGGSFLGSDKYRTAVEGSSETSSRVVGLSYAAGAKIGARVTDNRWCNFGTSVEYSYSNQPLTFTNLSDSIPSLGLGHAIHRFSYNIIYYTHDRSSRLRPFVFGGPGTSLFYIKGGAKDDAAARGLQLQDCWKFTMNWGGGVKYLLRNRLAATAQFGDSVSGVPGYGLPKQGRVTSGGYVPGFHPDGLLNNWMVEAGVVFQWNWD